MSTISTNVSFQSRSGRGWWIVASAAVLGICAALGLAAPANAQDFIAPREGDGYAIVAADQVVRTVTPTDVNATPYQGLAATIRKAAGDTAVVSPDGRTFSLLDSAGSVLLSSANPTIGVGARQVDAKFVLVGDTLIVTPALAVMTGRAACSSSFWGNVIFNVGMTGMCAALAVGTVVGGVVCTAALIGANTGINWDSQC